jgi:alpha-galactosidase
MTLSASGRDNQAVPTVTLLGAGSVVFTRELLTDIFGMPELAGTRIALHDIDSERLETAEAIARRLADQRGAKTEITASLDRRTALDGASYVINSIQVGMYQATRRDFDLPARYGLRQTIADTIGIGGIFRGLRTFPVLAGIAADMADLCPDAWLLNYTNPMAMNVSYLAATAPRLKVLGLCHSVYWTVRGLCEIVDVPFEEATYHSAGVNHQAWILRWERGGRDLYPLLDRAIAGDPQLRRRVRVDMYRRLGYYPTETSEHSAEYVPWYLGHDAEVDRLRIPVGGYLRISEENLAEYAACRRAALAGEDLDIQPGATEYAPQVIRSMAAGIPHRIIANVANRGLITNLPDGFAVEVPCDVGPDGATPLHVGDLPAQCAAVNRPYVSVGELTVRAAVEGDPRLVRQAAMVDPNAAANLTLDEIWSLCDELTLAHGSLLPEPLRTTVTP